MPVARRFSRYFPIAWRSWRMNAAANGDYQLLNIEGKSAQNASGNIAANPPTLFFALKQVLHEHHEKTENDFWFLILIFIIRFLTSRGKPLQSP